MTEKYSAAGSTIKLSGSTSDLERPSCVRESTCSGPLEEYFVTVSIFTDARTIRASLATFYMPQTGTLKGHLVGRITGVGIKKRTTEFASKYKITFLKIVRCPLSQPTKFTIASSGNSSRRQRERT